ncbi:serine-rich adhesin for platelets isoform X5 [Anopheles funestus]|uniref:serine-rich adhesin for platelets isoform X5 n=1 Tax=Anopheles funestus TaxID=62324 RepID=UPI0020C5B8B9|nr:serine-rich adhesin for platelets isoform X5 [Anopheles funestus]
MTSILTAPGKYRSRKDYSTGSIPTLVSLDEESSLSTTTTTSVCSDTVLLHSLRTAGNSGTTSTNGTNGTSSNSSSSSSNSTMNIKNGLTTKPPRRSSLGLALLGGGSRASNGTEKSNKRRSSIAVVFLGGGRKDSKSSSISASSTGNGHHNHNGHSISTIPEKYIKTGESDIENDSPNTDTFVMLGESGTNGQQQQDPYGGAASALGYDKKRRRSSSWQTKLERRRRKGMMASLDGSDTMQQDSASFSSFGSVHGLDSSPYGPGPSGKYGREKRHSWWNIFVPDNLKQRTRRASQDVILSKSSDTLSSPPYRRSKSRSVDHGLAAPFDLDSLRSKVEGRFESIDRLSKDGEKKRSMPTIPTITYTVKDRDTLTSVAARFDTTPSELTQLNRLASSFIYSGQQLLVPDKNAKASADGESDTSTERSSNSPTDGRRKGSQEDLSQDEKDLLEGLRPGSPKPGHIERVASPNTQSGGGAGGGGGGGGGGATGTAAGGDEDDPVTIQRFLKINVRHITDGQGVVGGVLLVTPNAVMFDPNVSDPLVIEHGPESYGVIAPMEFIVNAAIFNDIAHMRVQGAAGGNETAEKAEIYHPAPVEKPCSRCDTHSPGKDSLLVKDETFPELGVGSVEGCDDQESICSSNERDGDAFPKAFERDLVTPNNLQRLHGDSTESGGSSVEPKPPSTEPPMFLSYDRDSSQSHTPNSLDHSAGASNEQQQQKQAGDKTDQTKTNNILEDPTMRSLEERRRSLLDQHWAIPSKDRLKCYCDQSSSRRSLDDEEAASTGSGTTAASSSTAGASSIGGMASAGGHHVAIPPIAEVAGGDGQLVKQSCHDSGIDIRDPAHGSTLSTGGGTTGGSGSSAASSVASIPIVAPIATKKVYSDADIVLSADWVPPLTIAPTHLHDTSPRSSSSLASSSHQSTLSTLTTDAGGRKKTSSVSFSVDEHDPHGATVPAGSGSLDKGGETKKNKMLKRLSYPLAWVEGLTGEGGSSSHKSDSIESAPNTGDSNQSVFSKVFSRRSSIGTFIRQHPSEGTANKQKPAPPKLDYRSMVSIDDMPTLFVSFDKLIPRPARACPDPPMYLRLRMGRKIGKNTPLPTTVMSYGKNKLRPEYWFSIPKNKVDELYRFLNAWVQHLYGELDEAAIKERGFELIQMDTEWTTKTGSPSKDGRSASEGEISEYTRESWELLKAPFVKTYNIIKSQTGSNDLDGCEVLSMSTDDYRKATLFASGSFDQDFQIPDLIGQTEILSEEHREKLCAHLPARAEGYSWSLVFSTSQHGFSLNSLYRKMHKLESPILIVIEDTDHNVFGALTSCSLHVSDHFYGTGESLLYKFNPHFKVFHWSGENLYFIKGNPESLAIGAGDGKFGLWLDGDLNQGRSQHCSTYSNEPLAPQEDFVIKTLECWAFV